VEKQRVPAHGNLTRNLSQKELLTNSEPNKSK